MRRVAGIMAAATVLAAALTCGCRREEPTATPPAPDEPVPIQPAATDSLLPLTAINGDVAMLAWFDIREASPQAIHSSLQALGSARAAVPDDIEQRLELFGVFRDAFVAAGGQAIVLGFVTVNHDPPAAGGVTTRPFLLIKVDPAVDPQEFQRIVDAAASAPTSTMLARYAPGWLHVQGSQLAAVPEDGDPTTAAALLDPLAEAGDAPVRMALHLTGPVRQALHHARQRLTPTLIDPLLGLETASVALTLGERPKLATRMRFTDATAAATFNAVCQALVLRGRSAVNGQADALLDSAMEQLAFEQDGCMLSLSLDETVVRAAPQLAPLITPLILDPAVEPVTSAGP